MTMRPGSVPLREIAECFEGVVPSWICTCSRDGVPNVTNLSIVHLVDDAHVGLSVQFFNKTRRNILENPRARVLVVSPDMLRQYRLNLQFDHTESSGPLFERMRSRLDAIASQSGMRDIFRLRGVDVYEVLECRPPDAAPHQHVTETNAVGAMTAFTTEISKCRDLDSLLTTALEQLEICFGYAHSFVMVRDETGRRLYTLTSRGFPDSGVGSEVVVGEGLIGSAADRRMPVRTTHLSRDRIYAKAIRQEVARAGDAGRLVEETLVPGLPDLQSQLVLPLEARNELLGVLCLQSSQPGCFLSADEERMQIVARHVAASLAAVGFGTTDAPEASNVNMPPLQTAGSCATVRYYPADDSVFIDDVYLTKGVPGRILYRLLQMYVQQRRQDFTNREIRLDPALKLPDFQANLEARLILLRRRLEERTEAVRLEHAGRGKLRLAVMRPLAIKVES